MTLINLPIKRIDYFETPIQIQFYYEEDWHLGIGYKDEIINCENGSIIQTAQVLMSNPLEQHPIVTYEDWGELYI